MGVIQHGANAVANLPGGFRNLLPDRRQNRDDVGGDNTPGWSIADLPERIIFETGQPLPGVNVAFPACLVFRVVLPGGFAERDFGGGFVLPLRQNITLFNFDRTTQIARLGAGLR